MKDLKRIAAARLPFLLAILFWGRVLFSRQWRLLLWPYYKAFAALRKEIGPRFRAPQRFRAKRRALIFTYGDIPTACIERVFVAALERAGYESTVLAPNIWPVRKAFHTLGIPDTRSLIKFQGQADLEVVDRLTERAASLNELLALKHEGVAVGRYAAATLMRNLHFGTIDFVEPRVRGALREALEQSVQAMDTTANLAREVRPDIVLMQDHGYTPYGEAFDVFIDAGIPVISWNATHEAGHITMKRYVAHNRDEHPYALDEATWQRAGQMEWSPAKEERLIETLSGPYKRQEWFSVMGTQFNTRVFDKAETMRRLGLDHNKKTAVIFPHMFWDAAFFWGDDLFENFEGWFCAVFKAACGNRHLNWIIKVHPANVVKNQRDGISGEYSEIQAIRKTVGELPDHVRLLEPGTDISTLSLYDVADYVLTVRGTVGIEAAVRGIRVLTGGTGRYDRCGFTADFNSRESLLHAVAHLEDVPPMTPAEIDLAKRYAYAAFVIRSLPLTSVDFRYERNTTATLTARLTCLDIGALMAAPDVTLIGDWLASGTTDLCDWADGRLPAGEIDFHGDARNQSAVATGGAG